MDAAIERRLQAIPYGPHVVDDQKGTWRLANYTLKEGRLVENRPLSLYRRLYKSLGEALCTNSKVWVGFMRAATTEIEPLNENQVFDPTLPTPSEPGTCCSEFELGMCVRGRPDMRFLQPNPKSPLPHIPYSDSPEFDYSYEAWGPRLRYNSAKASPFVQAKMESAALFVHLMHNQGPVQKALCQAGVYANVDFARGDDSDIFGIGGAAFYNTCRRWDRVGLATHLPQHRLVALKREADKVDTTFQGEI
eukprot:TRINITY_DN93640_c0_g1_i1.p1 TRINITY_DN93640_c0_g1~~TRINITY_DN93640_c0_g1_i1.p1  ORF type:complete len:260 (-),score=14.60 TRINITY_DN93640_c0_g1_i1:104-850(-)